MLTDNKYLAVQNLGLVQRQAGVDPEIADLVCAFARLRTDAGRPLDFYEEDPSVEKMSRQFCHAWLVEKNADADPRLLSFLTSYGSTMASRRLPIVYSVGHLANKLRVSEARLRWMSRNQHRLYREFRIPKANGRERVICAPEDQLLTFQNWILRHILNRGKVHKYACGFVRGKSILDNARPHIGRKVVVRLDLADFFPSITQRQVRKVFERFGYPYRVASVLANLCTLDGRLPQGAPTSPAISNLICVRLDRRLEGLKKEMKFRYSRYADDLVFSSDNPKLPALIPFLKEIIRSEGFAVNEDKVRIMRAGVQQKVTGVVVNTKTGIPRKKARQLRAAVHTLRTKGIEAVRVESKRVGEVDPVYVLRGQLSFMQMVKPDAGRKLMAELAQCC
ncbi:MAG TPA: retron St85 family RNA-directed DNA polymerase [Kiritimatiellia bacterium]|nr:retron St85 family RNA-directed DNA polymerase [Kiritimatiellia bacterium]